MAKTKYNTVKRNTLNYHDRVEKIFKKIEGSLKKPLKFTTGYLSALASFNRILQSALRSQTGNVVQRIQPLLVHRVKLLQNLSSRNDRILSSRITCRYAGDNYAKQNISQSIFHKKSHPAVR